MVLLRLLVKLLDFVAVLVLLLAGGVRENHDRLTGCVGAGVAAGALVVW